MSGNQVVIYSNGIADFQRCYEVDADSAERISIPVRQDHLADVLGSFNVYGNVRLESPPTFRPSNELEGNISINPQKALEDLATSLSGARVRVDRAGGAVEGVLVGLHQEDEGTAGEPIHPKSLVVLAADGLKRCVLRDIQSFQFIDEEVQAEIEKALQRNYQRIKPNSTFVELVLSAAEGKSEAVVQYAIPAAAWKISYRIRMVEGRPTELQGFAIVDNNTDEDWNDFRVSVVTGEPITFSTDLAESKSPKRKHVNLVSETALGAVEVEGEVKLGFADEGAMFAKRSQLSKNIPMAMHSFVSAGEMAEVSSAEVHEVGDFCVFECDSLVTIPAKRSAVIPVFDVEVADAKSVLHYKYEDHASRPYRSVDFINQTEFSLGRGVCTVFEQGVYAGNCIIPALKPKERRLLPHALETGVSIHRHGPFNRDRLVGLRMNEGVCFTSKEEHRETNYHVKSSADQEFELFLDHSQMAEAEVDVQIQRRDTSEPLEHTQCLTFGRRYSIKLEPRAEFIVKIIERRVEPQSADVIYGEQQDDIKFSCFETKVSYPKSPLATHDGVRQCLEVRKRQMIKRREISDAVHETERLALRQERLRENIKAGGQDELTSRWRGELDEAEQTLRKLEEEGIAALRSEEKAIQKELYDALNSLSAEWIAPANQPPDA